MMIAFSQIRLPLARFSWRRKAVYAVIPLLLGPVTAHGQSKTAIESEAGAPYFATPQKPERLAALLYRPRVRSAHVENADHASKSNPAAKFSMAVRFAFDSAKLQRRSLPMLDSIGQMMNLPKVRHEGVVIEGHTDAKGPKRYNARLALRRAQAIKRYLADVHDIHPVRMLTVSFGETRLVNPEDPMNSRNRRVAFRSMRLADLHNDQ